jgi:hypothetical protein
MTTDTLLMIFIGLVALSLLGIAGVAIAIGIQVHGLLVETRVILKKLHAAGDVVLEDFHDLRTVVRTEGLKARGVISLLLSMLSRKARASRKSAKANPSDASEE